MIPHRSLFSQHPFIQLAVAFAAGICVAHYFASSLVLSVVVGAVFSLASFAFVVKRKLWPAGLGLLAAFFFLGHVLATVQRRPEQMSAVKKLVEKHSTQPWLITGVLDGPPEFARDRLYLSLRVERIADQDASGRVWLLAPFRKGSTEPDYRLLDLRYGARIQVTATLDRTGNYRNPGVSTLSEYLERRDFDATGIIRSSSLIARLDDARVFRPLAQLYQWRERLQRAIDARFAPETAGVLAAALLGNRYNLSREASERFREGGTFHVLVISGLHISFIGGVVFLLVRRLTKRRLVQFLLPAAVVWSYSFAVGAESSVVRAALMFSFAGLATIVFRQSSSLNALGAAALVLLVRSPKELFDPSFQLTFLSVLAIVVVGWPLLLNFSAIGGWHPTRTTPYPPAVSRGLRSFCEVLFWSERDWRRELARSSYRGRLFKAGLASSLERCHLQRCLRYVFGAIVVSAGVQLVLLPLMIVYFHRLSPASLLLNIAVSVLLAALVAVALLALLVAEISEAIASPLIALSRTLEWAMVHTVDPFSDLGLASMRIPEYSGKGALAYAFYYVPLLLLAFALAHWRPLGPPAERRCRLHRLIVPAMALQLVLLVILIFHPLSSGFADKNLHVDFLDVGQGDAAVVTMPDGTILLIDGGGRPSFTAANESARRIGETVVSEYLWWRGLSKVDYVVATHADADHIDGLSDVLKNFSVTAALVGRRPAADPEFAKFSQAALDTRTRLETIQTGDSIRFGDAEIEVLWPRAGEDYSGNNDSVVLRIRFGRRAILLTGDIERAAETILVSVSAPLSQSIQSDVLKVPHHGSKTSSTEGFVLATKPAFAIISAGRNSMFGHPHQEVVQRWRAIGATVLTTSAFGAIRVSTDGDDLRVETFIEPLRE